MDDELIPDSDVRIDLPAGATIDIGTAAFGTFILSARIPEPEGDDRMVEIAMGEGQLRVLMARSRSVLSRHDDAVAERKEWRTEPEARVSDAPDWPPLRMRR